MKSISKTKIWIFRFILAIGSPLAFFLLLELTLRLVGYGYPSTLLLPQENGTLGTNTKFAWRFFDPKIARIPEAISIAPIKPPNTKRIFVLGGSAAQGVPHSAYSFSRLLEVMLDTVYPEQNFEIYNVAMTAINSHVVLPIARECAALDPDLFIVYMGNNEVVGPYGPGSVITPFQPNLSIIRLSVGLKATRTGQLLSNVIGKIGNDPAAPSQWTGMDIFVDKVVSPIDPRLESVYSHFQSNLRDIIDVGRNAGAHVLVSTVATNLMDSPPFSSQHSPSLSDSDLQQWQGAYDEATKQLLRGNYSEALALLEKSELANPQHALLAYQKAQSFEKLGQLNKARGAYIDARNLDALRFRADSALNERIKETVQTYSDERVALFDAERAFGGTADSTYPIAGYDDFFEHVHLTFEGSYKLANGLLNQLPNVFPELLPIKENRTPSSQTTATQLGWNSWGKIQQLDGILPLIDRPPFTYQVGHEQRLLALRNDLNRYSAELGKDNATGALQNFANALVDRPEDPYLHQLLGELYYAMNRHDDAFEHINAMLRILPTSHDAFMQLAYVYFRSGQVEESLPHFRRAIELSPYYSQTQIDLASALAHLKRFEEAEEICQRLIQRQPEDPALQFGYGYVLLQAGKLDAAEEPLLKAFTLDPNAFHLRQLVDPKLRAAGKQSMSRKFDSLFIESQPDRKKAYGQLIDYYFNSKDIPSVKYYNQLRDELEISEE
ncbi:MAG: tetratricopeptide repeat protein [Opitutaceae bacterium]|nr:tetratricopeptide repeat protein [Opitutaceae bacterium]